MDAPSPFGAAIAAADALFGAAGDSAAVGAVFDLDAFGGPGPRDGGRFAAFARSADFGRPSRFVGFADSDDAANALLARDRSRS